jgi:hypothetical protein
MHRELACVAWADPSYLVVGYFSEVTEEERRKNYCEPLKPIFKAL